MKDILFGNLPIRKAKFGGGHPHVIVYKFKNKKSD